MSKHTPGPWRIGPKLQGASFTIVNPNGDAEMGNWLVARAHWEQDARLIAAAPETAAERDRLKEVNAELVAAGALALNQLSYALQRASLEWDNVAITTIGTAINKLRTAISKATGGENV